MRIKTIDESPKAITIVFNWVSVIIILRWGSGFLGFWFTCPSIWYDCGSWLRVFDLSVSFSDTWYRILHPLTFPYWHARYWQTPINGYWNRIVCAALVLFIPLDNNNCSNMRPPPKSVEEYLYRLLIDSPAFNGWVRRVHARINGLPPPHLQKPHADYTVKNYEDFHPTRVQKFNAFRILWADELKRSFGFGRK